MKLKTLAIGLAMAAWGVAGAATINAAPEQRAGVTSEIRRGESVASYCSMDAGLYAHDDCIESVEGRAVVALANDEPFRLGVSLVAWMTEDALVVSAAGHPDRPVSQEQSEQALSLAAVQFGTMRTLQRELRVSDEGLIRFAIVRPNLVRRRLANYNRDQAEYQ